MKFFILLLLCLCSGGAYSQYFNVSPQMCDSVSVEDYNYHITGYSDFPDTFSLHIELIDYPGDTTYLYQGEAFFTNDSVTTTIPSFSYNSVDGNFSFVLGHYPQKNLMVHMWLEINGLIENETLYRQYNEE